MPHTRPAILFIAWRNSLDAPPGQKPNTYVVGRLIQHVTHEPEVRYEFCYVRQALEAVKVGFPPLFEFDRIDRVYQSPVLFHTFGNRVMSEKRPDYTRYLRSLALATDQGQRPDPLRVLVRSEGRKSTDHLEVFGWPETSETSETSETKGYRTFFWLRGLRHRTPDAQSSARGLKEGTELELVDQPTNEVDPLAIQVQAKGIFLGYVAAYLCPDIHALRRLGATPKVRVGPQVPDVGDGRFHLLLQIQSEWPDGFVPYADSRFQPIAQDATDIAQTYDPRTLEPLDQAPSLR